MRRASSVVIEGTFWCACEASCQVWDLGYVVQRGFFYWCIRCSYALSQLVLCLWKTCFTAHTLVACNSMTLTSPANFLCIIECPVAAVIWVQSHVELLLASCSLSQWIDEYPLDGRRCICSGTWCNWCLIIAVHVVDIAWVKGAARVISVRALLGQHEVVLPDHQGASLVSHRRHQACRLLGDLVLLRLVLLLLDLNGTLSVLLLFVILQLAMLSMFLQFEIESSLSGRRRWSFLRDQTCFLGQGKLLGWLRTWWSTWALVRLHRFQALVAWTLWNFSVKDFLQIWLLVKGLGHLLQRLHRRVTRLLSHWSLVTTDYASKVDDFSLWGASVICDVLNYLVSPVAQTASLRMTRCVLATSSGLRIVGCAVRRDLLTYVDAVVDRLIACLELRVNRGRRLLCHWLSTTWCLIKLRCLSVCL